MEWLLFIFYTWARLPAVILYCSLCESVGKDEKAQKKALHSFGNACLNLSNQKFFLLSRHKTVLKVPCFLLRFYNPQVRHCTAPSQIRIRTFEIEGVSIQAFCNRRSPTSDDRHHPQKRFGQEQGDIDSSISSLTPLWLALPHYVKSDRLHHQGTWPLSP